MITNKEVFDKGKGLEHYHSDVNQNKEIEKNGSIENVVLFNGKKYCVITDWKNSVRWCDEIAEEIPND